MNGKPSPSTIALAILAAAGWGWGIYQSSNKSGDGTQMSAGEAPARTGGHRGGEARPSSVAALLPTARSARLFASLDEIAAVPKGSVNQKLLGAMRTTLSDNDPTRRNRDFSILLEFMRPEDALAVHNMFLEFHRDGQTFGEYIPFANRWGQVDGAGALEALMNEKPFRLPPQDLRNIIVGWSTHDPQAALAWLKDHSEVSAAGYSFDAVIQGWINLDREAATKYLIDTPLSLDDRIRATRNAADEILSASGVEAMAAWLTSFPATQENATAASVTLSSLGWRLGELPYDKAADVWTTLSAKSIGGFEQLARFTEASGEARTATNGTRGFIDALAEKWPVDEAISSFATWSQRNPQGVKAYIAQNSDSPYIESINKGLLQKGIDLSAVPEEETPQPGRGDPFVPGRRGSR